MIPDRGSLNAHKASGASRSMLAGLFAPVLVNPAPFCAWLDVIAGSNCGDYCQFGIINHQSYDFEYTHPVGKGQFC